MLRDPIDAQSLTGLVLLPVNHRFGLFKRHIRTAVKENGPTQVRLLTYRRGRAPARGFP